MSDQQYTLELAGCRPIPLAHYLKALGVLRLVSDEKVDPEAKGWWQNDTFWLRSKLDRDGLVEFFLERYEPTPIVAPWNGGSGFYASDSQEANLAILNGKAERFSRYRELIGLCRRLLESMSLDKKPDNEAKTELLLRCRNEFPDEAIRWLDAAFVLTQEGAKYPPLLGTGGNDGRLEFTNNYMQRLCDLFSPNNGEPASGSEQSLRESLFEAIGQGRSKSPIGQFDPGSAGGANATSGFDGASSINDWDYLLMLEGALVFAAATVKRLEHFESNVLACPFCVHPAGIGYGSANASDELGSRSEMWFPVWTAQTSYHEVASLFAEGRATVHARRARNGVEFSRAIAALGIDRGITSFCRYGFQQRNGLAYFAVPLERFHVRGEPLVEELLAPIDSWLDRFRRTATSKNAPARAGRALQHLESAILELCRWGQPRHVQDVLVALGEAEVSVAISPKLRDPQTGIGPVPLLSSEWVSHANDRSAEYRLAAALASIGCEEDEPIGPMRQHLEPIDPETWNLRWPKWDKTADDPNLVWGGGSLVQNLIAVLHRRTIEAVRHGKQKGEESLLFPGRGRCTASLGDIAAFIDGQVDDRRIEALLRGFILVAWRYVGKDILKELRGPDEPLPNAAYAILKLCHLSRTIDDRPVPLTPAITRRAASGDIAEATQLAARRLRGSGFPPAIRVASGGGQRAPRVAAALLFPVWHGQEVKRSDVGQLMKLVLPPSDTDEDPQDAAERPEAVV